MSYKTLYKLFIIIFMLNISCLYNIKTKNIINNKKTYIQSSILKLENKVYLKIINKKNNKLINILNFNSSSTGIYIKHKNKKYYILTVFHSINQSIKYLKKIRKVLYPNKKKYKLKFIYKINGISYNLKNHKFNIQKISKKIRKVLYPNKKKYKLKFIYKINGISYNLKNHKFNIQKISKKYDLMILYTKQKINYKPMIIAKRKPKQYTKIRTASVPLGYHFDNFIYTFQGIYLGERKKKSYFFSKTKKSPKGDYSIYTSVIYPGSSGGAITQNNKLIGVILGYDIRIRNSMLSATLKEIQTFTKFLFQ